MHYSVSQISQILQVKAHTAKPEEIIQHVLTDSRQQVLENSVFFALQGPRYNAHAYIPSLIKQGVKNFVVSQDLKQPGINYWKVKDTTQALQLLAKHHRKLFKKPLIAITGSNGKTVVKEWLYDLLWKDFFIVKSPKSYNSQIGVPLSLLHIQENHQLGIFEAGISKQGEMQKLQAMMHPSLGIFTNIGSAHEEGFDSLQQKIEEKLSLFKNVDTLVYCADDLDIDTAVKKLKLKTLTWAYQAKARITVKIVKIQGSQSILKLTEDQKTHIYTISFIDQAYIENALHCIACLRVLGYAHDQIIEKIAQLRALPMRLEMKEGLHNNWIINDTYSADLSSMQIALDYMARQNTHTKSTRCILSDFLHVKNKPELYKTLAKQLQLAEVQHVMAIGPDMKKYFKTLGHAKVEYFKDTVAALQYLAQNLPVNQFILIKGARAFALERISSLLEKKVHETRFEVNLAALEHNLHTYRSLLDKKSKMMAMVKAQSYGHGLYEVAKTLEYNKIDYLGVAYIDEGVELRQKGIKTPIMVMNPEAYRYDVMCQYQLEPVVYSLRIAQEIAEFLKQESKASLSVHIEVETGMHRLGIEPNDGNQLISILLPIKRLQVRSVFSHFSSSDKASDDAFTKRQIQKYQQFITFLHQNTSWKFLTHLCNSAGIERFSSANQQMVRLGIGLYGVSTQREIQKKLLPVGVLKTNISQIKVLKKGDVVGYGTLNKATKPMKIATLPVGYADGLHRMCGQGKVSFWLQGQKTFLVGNVCMDLSMIDVTDIKGVKEGDEVILFKDAMDLEKISKSVGTIPYEILTSISQRVKRIYYHE